MSKNINTGRNLCQHFIKVFPQIGEKHKILYYNKRNKETCDLLQK